MTARFAGSRTLDERRRRWLATQEQDKASQAAAEKSPPSKAVDLKPKSVNLRHFPIRKVISPKAWKITLTGLAVALCGVMIVGIEFLSWMPSDSLGPGWQRVVSGHEIRLAHLFHAGLLMMSGQLALFIWWARSQSLRDFEGQFRIWVWAALSLVFAGWGLIGQWHWAFGDTICWLWSAQFPQRQIVCWMLPACIVAGILWKKLSTDMRECKWSFALMGLGLLMGLGACVFRLGIDRTLWPVSTKQLAGAALQMGTCVAIFVSLLVHARHVIHVSAEPPKYRLGLGARIVQWAKVSFQKLPKPKLKLSALWRRKPKTQSEKPAKIPRCTQKPTAPVTNTKVSKPENPETKSAETSAPKAPVIPKAAPPEFKSVETKVDKPVPTAKSQPESTKATKPAEATLPPKPAMAPKPVESKAAKTETKPVEPKTQVLPPTKPAAAKSPPLPPASSVEPDSESDLDDEGDEAQYRIDQPLDPGQLKGLSKKERRKLRKQHRDSQRNS